jgi:hypothetical protein
MCPCDVCAAWRKHVAETNSGSSRTPADAVGAGELPPLPRAHAVWEFGNAPNTAVYTVAEVEQIRAADRAQRKQAGQVGKPCGWLAGNSSDGGETMCYSREAAQRECDEYNAYERSQPDSDPESLRTPEPVYRAAPASAQPADDDRPTWEMVQARERDIRALQSKVIELEAGAQPDQRESAEQAEKCRWRLCRRADHHAAGCTTYDPARYPDEFADDQRESAAEVRAAVLEEADQAIRSVLWAIENGDGLRDEVYGAERCREAVRALTTSPAAQPVAKDEQKGNQNG